MFLFRTDSNISGWHGYSDIIHSYFISVKAYRYMKNVWSLTMFSAGLLTNLCVTGYVINDTDIVFYWLCISYKIFLYMVCEVVRFALV